MQRTIEEIKQDRQASKGQSSRIEEMEIIARFGDGSLIVSYVHHYQSFSGQAGTCWCSNRRAAFYKASGDCTWDMLAE